VLFRLIPLSKELAPFIKTYWHLSILDRSRAIGADAVVGVDIDYEVLGGSNGMLMVTVSGTAVKLG
jgi:hypothetical protein